MDPRKKDDDSNLVACQRVADRKADVPSVIRKCTKCNEDVYISYVTLERIEKEGEGKPVIYACMHCLPSYDIDLGETLRPSPEQIKEIEAATGIRLTEADIARGMARFKTMFRSSRSERN